MPTSPITLDIPAPQGWQVMPLHDFCKLFPETIEEDYSNLLASMKNDGYYESEPIVLIEAGDRGEEYYEILDGRNRHSAALDTGEIPSFVEYVGEKPLQFVIAKNLNRRHLTTGQKAALASKIANMKMGDNQFTPASVTQPAAAVIVNVGTASIRRYKKLEQDAPEVAEEVAAGKISLAEGQKQAGNHKEAAKETHEEYELGAKRKERKRLEEIEIKKERKEFIKDCLDTVHEKFGLTVYDDQIRHAIELGMSYEGN